MNDSEKQRREEWENRIKEQRESGKSILQWCKEKGMSPNRFHRWKKHLSITAPKNPSSFSRVMVVEQSRPPIDPIWTAKFLKELFK